MLFIAILVLYTKSGRICFVDNYLLGGFYTLLFRAEIARLVFLAQCKFCFSYIYILTQSMLVNTSYIHIILLYNMSSVTRKTAILDRSIN